VERQPQAVADVLLDWTDSRRGVNLSTSWKTPSRPSSTSTTARRWRSCSLGEMLAEVTAILREHRLALPPDLALLIKAFVSLESMGRGLDPDFHMAAEAQPLLRQVLRARYTPRRWPARLAGPARTGCQAGRLPQDLSRAAAHLRPRACAGGHRDRPPQARGRPDRPRGQPAVGRAGDRGADHRLVDRDDRRRRPTLFGLPAFGLLGFVGAVAGGVWLLRSIPVAAQPLDAQALLQDLSQFRTAFLDRDRALAGEARREAESRLQGLTARAGTLDRVELGLELARIAALADNGHSLVLLGPLLDQSNRVPIRLTVFEGQFHVVRARQAHAGLLGGRLLAIDDIPLERLRQTAHALVGGVAARRDRQAPPLLESPHMLHALGLVTHPASARYRVELATGAVVEQRLVAEEPAATRPRASTERLLLPEVTPAQDGWLTALGAADAPWSLRDALSRFRWRDDARLDALVVELRQTFDASGQRLQDFFAQVHEALAARPRSHLVLDLRLNGGGDLTKARDFVEDLPRRVPGRIVVLTSPWTFSAAISLAGYLKQAAPERAAWRPRPSCASGGSRPGRRVLHDDAGGFVRIFRWRISSPSSRRART
jgi:hypothetical protein